MERMLRIHQEVGAGKFPNGSKLAEHLEVSTKSIQRDIEFMRDRLNLPIEYDSIRNGFYYTQPVSSFPTLQVSEGELVALVLAEKALQQYRGTSFEKPLVSAFKKLASQLPDTVSFSLSDWDGTISFRTSAEPILNLATFDLLARATAQHQQIKFEYRKPGQQTGEWRIADPYHLANINGEWFLFAYDHGRKDIRTFVPARMNGLCETGATFQRPEKFSVDKRLQDSFGVISGKEVHEVVIHFSRFAADYIREKRWHASQQLTERRDGELELRMSVASLAEVQRWVLSWGEHATVIRPAELRQMVFSAAQQLASAHSRAAQH